MSNPKKVIIITNRNNRQMVLTPKRMTPKLILSNLKVATVPRFKEDIIYQSSNCDFLKGESQQVLIVNKVNIVTKTCRTIAKCSAKGVSVETTSDDVCALIGQNNYDTALSALSSVFNEETKVRGILALLRKQTRYRTAATQTETSIKKEYANSSCQTAESHPEMLGRRKQRKRIRRQNTPYVVKEVKKCVININDVIKKEELKKEFKDTKEKKVPELPDIKAYVDEDSNISCKSDMTSFSMLSHPELLDQSKVQETLDSIQKQTCTLNVLIEVYDGTNIMIPVKPEDEFHIATQDILKNVTNEERMKLLYHQAYIDYKKCLERNEDGYYPLHIAVLHNDVELVRRQCTALRWRQQSVDKPAAGMTALQMAVHHNSAVACTRELLRGGADPLRADAERRSALHLAAAAAGPAHLAALLEHCDQHPREVLKNNQVFWQPQLESMPDKDLVTYLYEKIGELFDDQGNTPLMVAAMFGRAAAAELLCGRVRALADAASPACGATALYRAVQAACVHAKEHGGSDNVPEHFLRTAEILVSHGADPAAENNSGSSVNSLLQESTIAKLSMCIVNAMPDKMHGKVATNMILVKDKDGTIAPEQARRRRARLGDATLRVIEAGNKRRQDMATLESVKAKSFKGDSVKDANSDSGSGVSVMNKVLNKYGSRCVVTPRYCEMKDASGDIVSGLKFVPNKSSNESKASDKPRIVIVENVSVDTGFSKINLPTAAVTTVVASTKPKDIVLVSARKNVDRPKYVNIAPKPNVHLVDKAAPSTSKGDGK